MRQHARQQIKSLLLICSRNSQISQSINNRTDYSQWVCQEMNPNPRPEMNEGKNAHEFGSNDI